MGIEFPERQENIHIRGEGACTLLGADHPRTTGDDSKILANPCPYDKEEIKKVDKWSPDNGTIIPTAPMQVMWRISIWSLAWNKYPSC